MESEVIEEHSGQRGLLSCLTSWLRSTWHLVMRLEMRREEMRDEKIGRVAKQGVPYDYVVGILKYSQQDYFSRIESNKSCDLLLHIIWTHLLIFIFCLCNHAATVVINSTANSWQCHAL